MGTNRRAATRIAATRIGRERLLWRVRLLCAVFATMQTFVEAGDDRFLSWALVVGFWFSIAGTGVALSGAPTDQTVRRVGALSMGFDAVFIAAILSNNLTDPAEPIHLITVLGFLEAAGRWPRRGGLVAAPLAGVAAGLWTVATYHNVGLGIEASYATMRAGIVCLLGLIMGWLVRRLHDQHEVLQRVLDTSQDLIVSMDRDGTIRSVNAASVALVGRTPEELIGQDGRSFLVPQDRRRDASDSVLASVSNAPVFVERRIAHADGTVRWIEFSIVAAEDGDGIHVMGRDVTERRDAERRVAVSEQRFRSLFDHNTDAVYSFDLDGTFTSANPATEALTGYSLDELRSITFEGLIEPSLLGRSVRRFREAAAGAARSYDTVLVRRGGARIDLDVTNMPIVVDDEVVGVFGVAKDVTDRRNLERELERRARYDSLTGLANRSVLEQALVDASVGAERTLLFIDLDRFKVVNDSLGHRSGDELLVGVTGRLSSQLREDDLLVRWAGDEFCVLLDVCTTEVEALAIADRLRAAVGEPFRIDGRDVRVTASIGVARSSDVEDPERIVQLADQAMYEAKRAGRNRISLHDRSHVPGPTLIDLEMELRHAVDAHELRVHYQPIVETASGEIAAVESLVRWTMPDGTTRPPDAFIPLAEETGIIRDLTRLVLGQACADLAAWDDAVGRGELRLWVNVSGADLADAALVAEVADALATSGLQPDRLVLEVTESMLLRDIDEVDRVIAGLGRLGVSLVIDDFGTGYSSMSQLHRLRVDACKVDRSFVQAAPTSDRDAAIVRSLCDLGDAFGFDVVGEGVETIAELDLLDAAGCRLVQGYLLARPADAATTLERLRRGRIDLVGLRDADTQPRSRR